MTRWYGKKDWKRDAYPLGAIQIRRGKSKDGARFIKVTHLGPKPKRWKPLARWWWEKNKGPVPAGMRVCHKDGDTLNDDPSNYALMTAGEVIQLYWRVRKGVKEKNRERASKGTAAANRDRGVINRALRLLPTRFYCVDPERRLIYNRPHRKLWMVMKDAGLVDDPQHWRLFRKIAGASRFQFVRGSELAGEKYLGWNKTTEAPTVEGAILGTAPRE